MTEIYTHEYTISSWNKEKMGVIEVKITVVSESQESDSLEAVEKALGFFALNLNIFHRIVLQGYKND